MSLPSENIRNGDYITLLFSEYSSFLGIGTIFNFERLNQDILLNGSEFNEISEEKLQME